MFFLITEKTSEDFHPSHISELVVPSKITQIWNIPGQSSDLVDEKTHILLKLCEGLPDSLFHKDQGLSVREAFHGPLQDFSHRVEEKGG